MIKEAMLYEQIPLSPPLGKGDKGGLVRCHICPIECLISPGKKGYCRVRLNEDGKLYNLIYANVTSVAVDPIEKKPLYHFYPGSKVFSLGTLGCNLRCIHCQNWQTAHEEADKEGTGTKTISPADAVKMAKEYNCDGIAWTYNEPTVWFEYTLECARLAKQNGLYTVYVTNGFISQDALETIAPYLDAYRIDVKGFTKEFYKKLTGISGFQPILEAAVLARKKLNLHVEVVTNVIPTLNDDEKQLTELACWIRDALGVDTPWHVTRFHPYLELSHLSPTPIQTLERARQIGINHGLRFVYIGNVPGHPAENTYCYNCKELLIAREIYGITQNNIEDGRCKYCSAEIKVYIDRVECH
ncbi:MAG: AmmeMemoRadiSam system radical SAM enzyme [Candidatus Brocadiales bacterium]